MTKEEQTRKKFEDESLAQLNNIVKVEKKKTFKKKSRAQQKEREQEIQKLLDTPQDINYEKAMQIYEDQPLEAKEITKKDKLRLTRLKKKAAEENQVVLSGEQNFEVK